MKKAPRAPDLIELREAREIWKKRAELPLPKARDLEVGSRPFEGEHPVRQKFLRPLPGGTAPEVVRLAEMALTFDPEEPGPVTALRLGECAQTLLQREAFEVLNIVTDTLREKRLLAQDGTLLLGHFYHSLTPQFNLKLKATVSSCERWFEASPNSLAARYTLARVYTDWAWEARGEGWAKDVTQEGWKLFAERLNKAQRLLLEVEESSGDPYPFSLRITIGMGLGLPRDEVKGFLDKAMAIEPCHAFEAYRAYDYYLFPRWHGTTEERAEFIEEAVAATEAKLGQGLYAILTEQPDELKVDKERRLKGYQDLLAANPASFHYFTESAELTLLLQGPEAVHGLYQKVMDGKFKLPLSEGDKLRLKHRLQKEFAGQSPPAATPSKEERATMLGTSLGMSRKAVEARLGPPGQSNQYGAKGTELHYNRGGANHSLIVDNESQTVVSMAGASVEVRGKTVHRGMTYSELEQALGPPTEVRKPKLVSPNGSFFLLYEPFGLVVDWRLKNEKVFSFSMRDDVRASLDSLPPVTMEEWKSTWKAVPRDGPLKVTTEDGLTVSLPAGWESYKPPFPRPRPRLRMYSFVNEQNSLQLELVTDDSIKDLDHTEDGLAKQASSFLYRVELSKVLETKSGKCAMGLYGTAIYESPRYEHYQIWYLSNGQDVVKATYTFSESFSPQKLGEVEKAVMELSLVEKSK